MGGPVILAPEWRYSKAVTLSDTVANAEGSIGIMNNAAAAGTVKVTYKYQTGSGTDVDDSIRLLAGEKLKIQLKRVWSTGTDIAEASLRLLY